MVTVSVPGKIHLMGEHAVVYGKPALLAAVNLRMCISVSHLACRQAGITSHVSQIDIASSEPSDYARYAVEEVFEYFKLKNPQPVHITIDSDIPSGYHLGSSAAVAVGVVAATAYVYKKIWDPQLFNTLAYEVEKKQHGNPSGGDNTAVAFGGLLWYRKETEFLKTFQQLPFSFPESLNHLYLIDTGRPKESTGEMVKNVKYQMSNIKCQMEKYMNENEVQVKRIAAAIKEENEREFIDAMQKGERTLESMGVVSEKVIPCIREIESKGGSAKILGGGGKKDGVGFLLCYVKNNKLLGTISKKYKFLYQKIQLGEEGLKLEKR